MRLKFIFALAVVVCGFTSLHAQNTAKITSSNIGYLEYLPDGYTSNNNDYPIVIFLHGIGERGTTSTDPNTLKSSVRKVENVGLAKYIKYGEDYPFIVISPQLKSSYGRWPSSYVMDVLNHVKKYLRIDESRIYITGLSLGGYGTWTTLGDYPDVFAAAVPICSGGSALSKACVIAAANIPLWAFHGTSDGVVSYTVTTRMINAVNACTPKPSPLAKTTLFSGLGHNVWDKTYKQTSAINWMLGFRKDGSSSGSDDSGTSNIAPVANAGSDKSTSSSSITLYGSGSDNDGQIVSYKWTKYSGAAVTLTNANSRTVTVSGMKDGNYYLRLTVTDDKGATDYDNMRVAVSGSSVEVEPSPTNIAPIAHAGSDKFTSNSSITLYGSGTDKDGKIVSYKWVKYYGGSVTLTNASSPAVTVSGMQDGNYFLRLTVTDDQGATHYDNMKISVSGSSSGGTDESQTTVNIKPVANAGSNRTTFSSTITLNGSGSDKDGRIVSYRWSQYGGAATSLSNANTSSVTVSGLRDGSYYFRLTVTDDRGATDYDNMLVVVSSSSTSSIEKTYNVTPVANAGPNKRVTSDYSSVRIDGYGTDKDGEIVSYKWIQYGGPDATLRNDNSSTVTVDDLREGGKYYLRLKVKDDDGAVHQDQMLLVVEES